jgi:hypothetical protein
MRDRTITTTVCRRGFTILVAAVLALLAFTTSALGAAPTASTDPATSVHHTSAVLRGHLDPGTDTITGCHFEWGTDTSYSGGTVPCDQSDFSAPTGVSATLAFLTDGFEYHFKLVVETASSGTVEGGDQALFTPGFSSVHTQLGSFGPDGTSATSFSANQFGGLGIRQSTQALFVMAANSGAAGGLYGFDASNPLAYSQLSGFNPLAIPADANLSMLAVDSSATASDGNLYYATEGQDELQQVSVSATGGTFKLCFDPDGAGPQADQCTSDLAYNAVSSGGESTDPVPGSVVAALQALPALGPKSVSTFGGPGDAGGTHPYRVGFSGELSDLDVPQLTCDGANLSGGSGCSVATTVQGVSAKVRGFGASGALLGGNFPLDITTAVPGKGGLIGDLAVDSPGHLWVINYALDRVLEYSASGAFLGSVDISAQLPYNAVHTSGGAGSIAIDSDGDLYLSSSNSSGDYENPLPSEGVWRYTAASGYTQATKFYDHSVSAIAVDPITHHVFLTPRNAVPDTQGSFSLEVQEYDARGDLLSEFGRGATGNEFQSLAVDGSNHYVYATGNFPSFPNVKVAVFDPGATVELPTLTARPPSAIAGQSATLSALVDPEANQVTDCHFDYVTEDQYVPGSANPYATGQSVPCSPNPGSGSGDVPVAAQVSLEPGTVYHYRVVATNADGTVKGSDTTFSTLGPKDTSPFASEVADTAATVHATIDPNGDDSTCSFEYGTDTSYGQSAPCEPASQPATDEVQRVTVMATAGQFRLGFAGAKTGDLSFDASPADVQGALNVLSTIGGSGGTVTVSGGPGDTVGSSPYLVTFGGSLSGREVTPLTTANGSTALSGGSEGSVASVAVTSTPKVAVSAHLTNLDPNTTYHFRLAATNADAVSHSHDATFATYIPTPTFPSCANDALRTGPSAHLPDCRAYEQVSPIDKGGIQVVGDLFHLQASPSGDAFAFESNSGGISDGVVGGQEMQIYVARRLGSGWETRGMLPPPDPSYGDKQNVNAWTPDLRLGFSASIRYSASALFGMLAVEPFAPSYQALYPPQTGAFGYFAGASTDDSKIFFQSNISVADGGGLTVSSGPAPAAGKDNLYLYDRDTDQLTLVGVLPASKGNAAPPGGSFAGPFDWGQGTNATTLGGGGSIAVAAGEPYFTQGVHAISGNGEEAFFTAGSTGEIYRREGLGGATPKTVQVSASQRTPVDPNGAKPKIFMRATDSGDSAFLTSCQKLTNDSTAVSTADNRCDTTSQGQDLYRWDAGGVGSCHSSSGCLTDLTIDGTDPRGAEVKGVLAASDDGDYAYFVANGVLASNAGANGSQATLGSCTQSGNNWSGSCNLYLYHAGQASFIARLSATDPGAGVGDASDWQIGARPPNSVGGEKGLPTAMASADRRTLVFASQNSLTSYPAHGTSEFYRYHLGDPALDCLTCNPTGVAPNYRPTLTSIGVPVAEFNTQPILHRLLSTDGSRFFFESAEKLVAADTNGDAGCPRAEVLVGGGAFPTCQDVYEWEADGSGSCHGSDQNGGCLYLLSTGTGTAPAFLGDASASGDDVFILDADQLVPQDADHLRDAYDVRVDGGLAAQHAAPPPPCDVNAGACEGAGTNPFNTPGAGSGSFQGPADPPIHRHSHKTKKKHQKKHKRHAKHNRRSHR